MILRALSRVDRAVCAAAVLATACDVSDHGAGDVPGSVRAADAATPIDDAAQPGDAADAEAAAADSTIGVGDTDVYAGATASITARAIGSIDVVAWSWALASAPAGSGVTRESIAAASGPTLTFTPDVVGDYDVQVTATLKDGSHTDARATARAAAAPVFYTRAVIGANGGEVAVRVAGHDGSLDHAVACAITFGDSESAQYRSRTLFAAATASDVWEARAGQPSRFAFAGTRSLTTDDAGAFAAFLIAGTTSDSCTASPVTLRAMAGPAGAFGQPRFSHDGTRLAFLDPDQGGFAIATIAIDGSAYRRLAPILAGAPSGGPGESQNVRPEWRDDSHVAWTRPLPGDTWSVMVAADEGAPAPAPPVTLMTCSGATTPHRVAFLADGSVVAAYAPGAGGPTDLFVLKPGPGGTCDVVRNLTRLAGAASRAHDFDLSPDGRTVAYLHYDAATHGGVSATGNEGDLYTVPVDGTAAPSPVGAAGATPKLGRIGPRWIGGGTRLAFTRAGTAIDGGDARLADDVTVISPDGSGARDLATGDGVGVVVGAVGPGGSCAAAGARRNAGGTAAALVFFGALAVSFTTRRRGRAVSRRCR